MQQNKPQMNYLIALKKLQLQESLEDAETNTDVIHKYNTST
jgi:hypothetical protein